MTAPQTIDYLLGEEKRKVLLGLICHDKAAKAGFGAAARDRLEITTKCDSPGAKERRQEFNRDRNRERKGGLRCIIKRYHTSSLRGQMLLPLSVLAPPSERSLLLAYFFFTLHSNSAQNINTERARHDATRCWASWQSHLCLYINGFFMVVRSMRVIIPIHHPGHDVNPAKYRRRKMRYGTALKLFIWSRQTFSCPSVRNRVAFTRPKGSWPQNN